MIPPSLPRLFSPLFPPQLSPRCNPFMQLTDLLWKCTIKFQPAGGSGGFSLRRLTQMCCDWCTDGLFPPAGLVPGGSACHQLQLGPLMWPRLQLITACHLFVLELGETRGHTNRVCGGDRGLIWHRCPWLQAKQLSTSHWVNGVLSPGPFFCGSVEAGRKVDSYGAFELQRKDEEKVWVN